MFYCIVYSIIHFFFIRFHFDEAIWAQSHVKSSRQNMKDRGSGAWISKVAIWEPSWAQEHLESLNIGEKSIFPTEISTLW